MTDRDMIGPPRVIEHGYKVRIEQIGVHPLLDVKSEPLNLVLRCRREDIKCPSASVFA